MAIDSTLEVRRAGMARLKAFTALNALVPADSIYRQTVSPPPDWPFVKWGSPSILPRKATCLDGSTVTVAVHGFAKPRMQGGVTVEPAEDHAARIGAQIAAALDGFSAPIANGVATFTWLGAQLLVDGADPDGFHTVQNFRVRCSTAKSA